MYTITMWQVLTSNQSSKRLNRILLIDCLSICAVVNSTISHSQCSRCLLLLQCKLSRSPLFAALYVAMGCGSLCRVAGAIVVTLIYKYILFIAVHLVVWQSIWQFINMHEFDRSSKSIAFTQHTNSFSLPLSPSVVRRYIVSLCSSSFEFVIPFKLLKRIRWYEEWVGEWLAAGCLYNNNNNDDDDRTSQYLHVYRSLIEFGEFLSKMCRDVCGLSAHFCDNFRFHSLLNNRLKCLNDVCCHHTFATSTKHFRRVSAIINDRKLESEFVRHSILMWFSSRSPPRNVVVSMRQMTRKSNAIKWLFIFISLKTN